MFMLNDKWRKYTGSWAASLALHGLLGGVIAWYAVSPQPPAVEVPPHWDVALVELPAPSVVPAVAEKPPVAPSPVVPQTISAPMPLADVPLATLPVNTKVESDAVFPLPLPPVAAQGVSDEIAAAPSTAASAPAPAAINTAELADLLWRRMEALKRYPGLARRNGWEGMVLIKVVLDGDGHLLSADIQQSSGYETLDQDALRVLRAATPLKNEKILVGQLQAAFMLPVPYRLQH